ncbi:PREDICTED: tumor necrosis factor receptor superfamily member 14-like, partial [Cyprinodon variegatus]|uniref:tumor necrosis factor receptor superfamily member 14-like n=1 Tax=Cyprinodon variegatus TaxID=28743 RepID=UPI000742BAA0
GEKARHPVAQEGFQPKGNVVGTDCDAQFGTRCIPCETGTFMNEPNGLTRCFSCFSCDPGSGLSIKQNCTSISDTVCDVIHGYFCKSWTDSAGCSKAAKHSACKPGQRIKLPGTSRDDTVCENCEEGTFSPDGRNCILWTQCSERQTKVQEGSSTSDVVCINGSMRHRYTLLAPFLGLAVVICLLIPGV